MALQNRYLRTGIIDGIETIQDVTGITPTWSEYPKWEPKEKHYSHVYLVHLHYEDSDGDTQNYFYGSEWNEYRRDFVSPDRRKELNIQERAKDSHCTIRWQPIIL